MAASKVVAICPRGHDCAEQIKCKEGPSILKEGAPAAPVTEAAEPMDNIVIDLAAKFMRIYCFQCGTWYELEIVVRQDQGNH